MQRILSVNLSIVVCFSYFYNSRLERREERGELIETEGYSYSGQRSVDQLKL